MKLGEFDLIAKYLGQYSLSLQSINFQPQLLAFKFWDGSSVINLVVNTQKAKPKAALLGADEFRSKKSLVKPITIYFDKHYKSHEVTSVFRKVGWGRVLVIEISAHKKIELQLVPHAFNILLIDGDKTISLSRPSVLEPIEESASEFESLKSLSELASAVMPEKSIKKNKQSPEVLLSKKIKKLEKTISKVESSLEEKRSSKYKEAAQALLVGEVPAELQAFINSHNPQNFSGHELVDYFFEKGKQNKSKLPVVEKKLKELNAELDGYRLKQENKDYSGLLKSVNKPTLLKSSGLKGRTFHLSDGFVVVRGKSATENLQLLRKSPAWFLWLHVKDAPGSHALIHRNKKEQISDSVMIEACEWLLKESIKSPEGRYDVIVTEKRYVKPIKGDKLGRVTYSKERVFCVTI